jgi:hypothetical protein
VILNQAPHWNGRKWSRSKVPNPDGTMTGATQNLTSISCHDMILHWNGTKWSVQ